MAIGPGTFSDDVEGGSLSIKCNPADNFTGYITFKGAGAQQTVMDAQTSRSVFVRGGCTHLNFSNFTITSYYHYITWNHGGESRWSNMEIIIPAAAWSEDQCGAERGKHYWFSSRLVYGSSGNRGYLSACDETWFFGSEIRMSRFQHNNATTSAEGFALKATGQGEIHVYGGNIRALGVESSTPVIQAADGGAVHIHGTGIDLEPSTGVNATLIHAGPGGMIHANNSAYSINATEGSTITRISNDNGHVHAPYLWEAHPEPPDITSVTGADMAVITNTDDGQPHMVIYSSNCPGSWFNTTTKSCL